MRIVIGVATADAALRAFVSAKRDSIVPPESLAKGYLRDINARFSPQIFPVDQKPTSAELGAWLKRLAVSADGFILLIDKEFRQLAVQFEDAYFVASLPGGQGKIIQNYIRSTLASVLKHFSSFSLRFDRFSNQRILLLPLNIFMADELTLLHSRLTHNKMQPHFGQDLDDLVASLRRRMRPKTKTRFKATYLIDDRPLWYRYGPEEHASVETTQPPHAENCWHNSLFRFGRAYNPRLHHNVDDGSDPSSAHGGFVSCHGQSFIASGQSHLNIFPNGFI